MRDNRFSARASFLASALLLCTAVVFGCRGLAGDVVAADRAAAQGEPFGEVSVAFDYVGAEAMLAAVERETIDDAELDRLLSIHGVRAIVDNTTRFIPEAGEAEFRAALNEFVRDGRTTQRPDFRLAMIREKQEEMRRLIAELRREEAAIAAQVARDLRRYQPPGTGPVTFKVYFVAGGVSDGFAFENDPENAIYAALDVAGGDRLGVVNNVTHELYHGLQKLATNRVAEWKPFNADQGKVPATDRLLMTTILEGTANLVADPLKVEGTGPYLEFWRKRFRHNAQPEVIAGSFALFDETIAALRDGRLSWEEAYRNGFAGSMEAEEGARFYFVGYEMAKALERYEGPERVGRTFTEPPLAFFRDYIALYRLHPEITARFSPATEQFFGGGS